MVMRNGVAEFNGQLVGVTGLDIVTVAQTEDFSQKSYSPIIKPRILRRAVFIVNKDNINSYAK